MNVGRIIAVPLTDGLVVFVDYQVNKHNEIAWWFAAPAAADQAEPELNERQIGEIERALERDLARRRQQWREGRECVA
ncbi:MAG TPA: hypothetical protein VGR70_06990 [Stellaceae bacterium]|nr:hypothetical protein [Stellaceae bacterium]